MNKFAAGLSGLAFLLYAAPSHAQATRTWVSGVGDDINPCSRTAPCKTFAGALPKTAVNGEINCLDPGPYGTASITKSISIDCHEVFGSILHVATNGMNINFDAFAATDVRRTVNIRNINFQGATTGLNGIRIFGAVTAGSVVNIEDCLLTGNFGATGRGIDDFRTGGGELNILNTTVRHMAGNGITIAPSAGGGTTIKATLENVRVYNTNNGLSAGNGTRVMVSRSVFSGNTVGVETLPGAELNLSRSVSTNNGTGLLQSGGTMRVSDSDITFNTAGVAGTVNSFSNNRFSSNGAGGTITAIAPAGTNPSGMQ